jgi:hypothetical protein
VLLRIESVNSHAAPQRYLAITMLTHDERLDTLTTNAQFAGQLAPEPQTIGVGANPDDAVAVHVLTEGLYAQFHWIRDHKHDFVAVTVLGQCTCVSMEDRKIGLRELRTRRDAARERHTSRHDDDVSCYLFGLEHHLEGWRDLRVRIGQVAHQAEEERHTLTVCAADELHSSSWRE